MDEKERQVAWETNNFYNAELSLALLLNDGRERVSRVYDILHDALCDDHLLPKDFVALAVRGLL